MAVATGSIIAGRYEILDTIGHGGMATVFRARRRPDGRVVALKVLYDQYAHAPEFVTRFQREARAAAALVHPQIVKVLDSGHDHDVWYIAMEHVEGVTLKELITREGALPAERACEIAAQVCEALHYAHSRGIVHRDVKPHNILITTDGTVKVADFGIARALAAPTITQTGSVLGSAQYLSPEQARGDSAGKASDLYAVGIVLYEMVTGRLPFAGESPVALALKHIQEEPPPPRTVDERIPARVEQIILHAMAKRPELRYTSAAQMRDDLRGHSDHWQDALTVVVPPEERTAILPPTSEASMAPAQQRAQRATPAIASLALVGLFVILVAGWLGLGPTALRSWTLPRLSLPNFSLFSTVSVPDLRGQPLERAKALAAERNLQIVVKRQEFHATYAKDVVINHDPAAGQRVRRQSIISVVLSQGEETVEVPNLRGQMLLQAIARLRIARLRIGAVSATFVTQAPAGAVISQSPEAGTRARPGTLVNLVVSAGGAAPEQREPPEKKGD